MSFEPTSALLGFVAGALVFAMIVAMILSRRFGVREAMSLQARNLNEAVINANLTARSRDVENLNFRLQELQQRLRPHWLPRQSLRRL